MPNDTLPEAVVEKVARAIAIADAKPGQSALLLTSENYMSATRKLAKAAIRAMLDGVEPVASVYTMHMEFGQTNARLADPGLTPFGIPGRDYSAEYPVTETPLYSLEALKEAL